MMVHAPAMLLALVLAPVLVLVRLEERTSVGAPTY
jgi:hypothetical protein